MSEARSGAGRGRAFPRKALLVGLGLAAPFLLLATLCLGPVPLSPGEVSRALLEALLPGPPVAVAEGAAAGPGAPAFDLAATIVLELRLPRTLLAALAGAALGSAGAVLQGLFRNPLADPYSLGVSSGASLGAVAAIMLGAPLVGAWAFAGACLAALAVFAISGAAGIGRDIGGRGGPGGRGAGREGASSRLLLAGAAAGSFLSALVSLIVSLNDRDLHRVFFWLLGGFGGRGWPELGAALLPAGLSLALALLLARPLDLLGAGEESAASLGLGLGATRALAVAAASLGAAAAVAAGGVIGFVGLTGPHLARALAGPRHALLIPASALSGALLLALADALARTVAAPLEMPVGVVTALLGAPLFLRLLARGAPGGAR